LLGGEGMAFQSQGESTREQDHHRTVSNTKLGSEIGRNQIPLAQEERHVSIPMDPRVKWINDRKEGRSVGASDS
jgi:hypothetical protein